MTPDYFDSLESQLVDATRKGEVPRVNRVRRRVVRWVSSRLTAVVVAVTVSAGGIAAGLTGPLANLANDHTGVNAPAAVAEGSGSGSSIAASQSPSRPVPIPPGGPVPAGFQPQSFTAISEFTWWMMGPAPCSSPPCTSIVRTVNGGVSFVGLHAPRTTQVANLRFADEYDGYAFGPQLWSTHDGGQTWQRVHLTGDVSELAASYPYVYAVVLRNGHGVLMRSPVGVDHWQELSGTVGYPFTGLWVQGRTVLVESQNLSGSISHLMVSLDRGRHFTQVYSPPPSVSCAFDATVDVNVIWAPCVTGMASGIWRSTDGGNTFAKAMGSGSAGAELTLPNSARFGAASASTAVTGFQRLYRTTDGGRTWSAVQNLPQAQLWSYIGFTDSTHGVAIGQFGSGSNMSWRLYYTTDAGASYHYVPITP